MGPPGVRRATAPGFGLSGFWTHRRRPICQRGGRIGSRGYFVEPTVLADVRPGMKVLEEEIFGPSFAPSP